MMNIGTLHDDLYLDWRGSSDITREGLPRREQRGLRGLARIGFTRRRGRAAIVLFFNARRGMNHRPRLVARCWMNHHPWFVSRLGMNYRTSIEAIGQSGGDAGDVFGGIDVRDVHRIAQQSHELEIQRCDDGADRRLKSHNRPKQTARTVERKIPGRAKSSKTARNAGNREMI